MTNSAEASNGGPSVSPNVGLVLAAGAGSRMGQPKALVRAADGTPWLEQSISLLQSAGCDPVVVVLGAEADAAATLIPDDSRVITVVSADRKSVV